MRVTKHATLRMGLLYVPIGVCTAAVRKDITFNGLHVDCGGRIGIKNYCKSCGEDDLEGKTVKGYEVSKQEFVTFTEAELEAFKPDRDAVIDITKFVPKYEVEPVMVEKMYWLQPGEVIREPYELLAQGLADKDVVAIGRTTLWGKEHPFAIDVDAGVLCMKLLYCFDELNSPSEIRASLSFDVDNDHRELIHQVIDLKFGTVETEDLSNISRDHAYALIAAKAEGKTIEASKPVEAPAGTVTLMETLKAMIA